MRSLQGYTFGTFWSFLGRHRRWLKKYTSILNEKKQHYTLNKEHLDYLIIFHDVVEEIIKMMEPLHQEAFKHHLGRLQQLNRGVANYHEHLSNPKPRIEKAKRYVILVKDYQKNLDILFYAIGDTINNEPMPSSNELNKAFQRLNDKLIELEGADAHGVPPMPK